MDSLNSWLPAQLFALAGLLVVGVVLMFIWRTINRPQLGGAAKGGRQSRLGVVDSYGVGTRQLVLVRRDNVEHLIMIGGPNDVVVESSILRARAAGQAPRPASPGATPPVQERAAAVAAAPRQVEEDFARTVAVEPPPVAKIETPSPTPVTAAPPPVATPAPAATAASTPPSVRPSVVPPREPGFFQRATSRLPTFNRPAATPTSAPAPAAPLGEEPRANIDAAHFEELLAGDEPAASPTAKPTAPAAQATAAPQATTTPKPKADLDFEVAEGLDLEPAPETPEPPAPSTTRLTLPEIRLPDLRLPEWRRPESSPAPTPAPARPAPEVRVEPRFSDPRPASESALAPGGRIEPSLGTPAPRIQAEPTRSEPFRIGERLTTPTRPATPPPTPASSTTATPAATAAPTPAPTPAPSPSPAPSTTPAPAEADDPFASLEEEMASLLGRNRDDAKKS